MSTEPTHDESTGLTSGEQKKSEPCCGPDWKLCLYDPNGDGKGKATCLLGVSCVNWIKILCLFAIYYAFLAMFFWAMIEALFVVKQQGLPRSSHATDL